MRAMTVIDERHGMGHGIGGWSRFLFILVGIVRREYIFDFVR